MNSLSMNFLWMNCLWKRGPKHSSNRRIFLELPERLLTMNPSRYQPMVACTFSWLAKVDSLSAAAMHRRAGHLAQGQTSAYQFFWLAVQSFLRFTRLWVNLLTARFYP